LLLTETASPDANILTIQLRQGKPADFRDIAEGIIVHISAKDQPLERIFPPNPKR
jgi:hypothetical protein